MNELLVAENHKGKKTNCDWIAPDTQGKISSTSTSAFKISLDEVQESLAR